MHQHGKSIIKLNYQNFNIIKKNKKQQYQEASSRKLATTKDLE